MLWIGNKGIDFSKLKSKKEQERIINYYYKFSQEVGKKIDKEQNSIARN